MGGALAVGTVPTVLFKMGAVSLLRRIGSRRRSRNLYYSGADVVPVDKRPGGLGEVERRPVAAVA